MNFELKKLGVTVLEPLKKIVQVKVSESILNHPSYYLGIARTNAKCLDKNHNERFELLDLCTRS